MAKTNAPEKPRKREEIKALEITEYNEARKKIQSGDLIFTSGEYLVSRAIQKLTGSPWSHVGIVFRVDSIDRVLLLESVEDMGVRFAPLSKYLSDYENGKPYNGMIVLARCDGVNNKVVSDIAKFGTDELTQPYDNAEIAAIVARIALGEGRVVEDRKYICSELVYECFRKGGIDFKYNMKGFISPEDIWSDSRVSLLCRIL